MIALTKLGFIFFKNTSIIMSMEDKSVYPLPTSSSGSLSSIYSPLSSTYSSSRSNLTDDSPPTSSLREVQILVDIYQRITRI